MCRPRNKKDNGIFIFKISGSKPKEDKQNFIEQSGGIRLSKWAFGLRVKTITILG